MRHIPVTSAQREEMLRAVGVSCVDDLFDVVPADVRLDRPLALPPGVSEMELVRHLRGLAGRDRHAGELVSFAGAGCYDHYVPAVVDHVVRKPELFTAYTPYQPEVSQGTLQAVYEFQSMVCALTGMEVANASMYDGATAMLEAALMAARVTRRRRVVVAGSMHPEWREVVSTYALSGVIEATDVIVDAGVVDPASLADTLDGNVAAVLVQSPGFYGCLEDLAGIGRLAHEAGALLVAGVNPILLGVMEPPASFGADIVVGEGQPLGGAMSFGGPGLGLFACRREHLRQMPGRVVGRTTDMDGRIGYVLTMQTREQHIRRERATSNICSNHSLNALAASAYLAAVGAEGLAAVGRACVSKAHYLRDRLLGTGRFASPWETPFAHEFALAYDGDVARMQSAMLEKGFLAGVRPADVSGRRRSAVGEGDADAADLEERLVILAVTEQRTREEMDAFAEAVRSV